MEMNPIQGSANSPEDPKEAKVSGANMLRCFKDISPHWKSLIPADTQAKVGENTLSALLSQ